ncbi:uncharacterized protein ISCGN_030755 [Ixodes scapularis]
MAHLRLWQRGLQIVPAAVPIGPKGRVIKDCEWRYRHLNDTDELLTCKKCVKEFDLPFPPRRSNVIQMRQSCVKPYTAKEAALVLCNAFHGVPGQQDLREECVRCVENFQLPENATKFEQREIDWKCMPHPSPTDLLHMECRYRFNKNPENQTECYKCVNNTGIDDSATFAEYRRVESTCMPRSSPKERLKRLCKWRYIDDEQAAQCQQCVDEYPLPANFEYEDVSNLRNKCLPRPSRKELLRKTCDWYFRNQNIEKSACEACVEKSRLDENASYDDEAQVRSLCMPRKPPRERVKDACPRRFKDSEEIEKCRKCADNFMNDPANNEVQTVDVQQLYRRCLAGNNLKARLLQECQQKMPEPDVANKCKACILRTYQWRVPKHMIREARKRCFIEGFQENES